MAGATDAVWIDVLPSMRGFGPALAAGAEGEAEKVGKASGLKFGKALLAGAAVIAGGAALASKALYSIGATFDDVSDTIRVQTGKSGAALNGLVDSAKNVGKTVPAEFEAIGPVIATLNQRLGLSGKTLEKVASQYLEAGRILGQEVDVKQTSAAFTQFGIEGDAVSGAMDHLFRVSQATGVGINQLAQTAQNSGPAMQQLGFSFEETTALAGNLDKAGLNSSRMMMGMSKALVTLAKDGEDPQQAFRRVTDEIQGFIEKGDKAAAIDLAGKVFGTRSAPQFISALESGAIALDDLGAVAGMTEDTILGAGKETADFAEKWLMFKNSVLVALEPIATRVFGALGTGMEWVTSAAGKFSEAWSSGDANGRIERLGVISRDVFEYLRGVGETVFPKLKSAFEGVSTAVSATVGFFREHEGAAKTLGGVVVFVGGLIAAAWVAQSAVATVNSVKSVIAWFATATASTTSATIQSRSTAQIVAGWLIASGSAVLNAGKVAVAWAVSVAQTGYLMALYASQSVASAARSAGAWVMAQLRTVASLALTAASFVASGAVMLFQMGVTAAGVVAGWVVMGVQSLIQAGRMAAAWLIAMGPVGWVIAAVIGLVALIIANWDTVVSWTKTAWDAVTGAISWAWEMIKTGVKAALDFLVWLFLNFTGPGLLIKHWDSIVQGAKNAWHWVVDNFTRMKDGVVGVFQGIVDTASSIWNGLLEVLKTPIRIAFDFVNGNMINPINEILKQFPGGLHIPSLPKLASGGLLRGPGTGTSDSILGVDPISKMPTAAVSNGEFVVKKKRVDQVGVGWLNAFNEGRLPGLATGGLAGLPKFGLGGWISGAWDATGGAAWDAAKGAVSSVKNFATDMLAKGARKAAEWVLKPLVDGAKSIIPNKVPLNMLTGGLDKLYQGIMGKADEQDREQQLSGGGFSSDSRRTPNGVGGLGPVAAAARLDVMKRFGLTNIGGYSYRTIAGTNTLSDHATGHAIDVMIPNYKSAAGISKGNAVANYFTGEGASRYPVKYVIWRDQINEGRGWKPYGHPGGGRSDTLQHRDHDHVSFFDQGGLWRSGTAGINLTGGVERVLTPPQDDYFRRFVDAAEGGRSGSALIDQLHIHEVHTDMEEAIGAVNHWTRVYSNGGRYAGAGSGS